MEEIKLDNFYWCSSINYLYSFIERQYLQNLLFFGPKGSGKTVRTHFLNGDGINSSYAIYKDASGNAKDKT